MADSKKLRFSKPPILKKISQKLHGLFLGLIVLIDARGIDVANFCVFRLFLSLCPTASQPYSLSHINALKNLRV